MKIKKLISSSVASAAIFAIYLPSQAVAGGITGYVTDNSGKIAHDGFGGCLRTIDWKPEHIVPGCGAVKDSDGDGVSDKNDQCPNTPKGAKVDDKGCALDSDGDGVADYKDNCPNTPKGAKVDSKGCALDSDGDGVADYKDKCPGTPAGAPVDANGCALDSDGDGIADYKDKCPGTKAGAKVDNNGCELKATIELKGVNFANNSAALTGASTSVLDEMASTLKRYPSLKVEVAGHTDGSGSRAYNISLSQKRAESVRNYLVKQGVAADRLTAKGYGPDKPVSTNRTREGRAKNRRVELILKK